MTYSRFVVLHPPYPCSRYVVRKDHLLNAVYVSRHYYDGDKARNSFTVGAVNWVSGLMPDLGKPLFCKVCLRL